MDPACMRQTRVYPKGTTCMQWVCEAFMGKKLRTLVRIQIVLLGDSKVVYLLGG